jgi:HPt (histidine-containing phosphotransfer) domain-containing protein
MEQVSATAVLDLCQLRNITLDDEELMREVVDALVSNTSHQIEELNRAVERADAVACARVAHSARGACGNVGAISLAALFSSVERDARSGDLTHCRSSVASLTVELEKLRSEANTI